MQSQSNEHRHPELERLIAEFAETTTNILRDLALAVVRIEARLDRIDTRLDSIEAHLRRINPNGHALP